MIKFLACILIILTSQSASAQKVESIHFNLYTDSLKKGFYNYINVDGQTKDGGWTPLDSTYIRFTASAGLFKGNDIFIDSCFRGDHIRIKAVLKSDPAIWKEVIIYIRKRGFDEPLKSSDQLLNDMKEQPSRKKKGKSL